MKLPIYVERDSLDPNPIVEFQKWFQMAFESDAKTADNFVLATCIKNRPSARALLLKKVEPRGFHFFTNYLSRKGQELKKNPYAAMVFNWKSIDVQVRIEGRVSKLPRKDSAAYFHSRPYGSQIGAWASPQSQVIPSREFLENKVSELEKKFKGKEVPLPHFWGGYVLKPYYFEFMFSRDFRLHDRFAYYKKGHRWKIDRLGP